VRRIFIRYAITPEEHRIYDVLQPLTLRRQPAPL
jgi:hypothetical protein